MGALWDPASFLRARPRARRLNDEMASWVSFGTVGPQTEGWPSGLVLLHAVSDGIIALTFFAIPLALLHIYRRRGETHPGERALIVLFALFIFAVGLAHLASLLTLLVPGLPGEGFEGLLKALGALLALTAAIVIWKLAPHLSRLPSRDRLQAVRPDVVAERPPGLRDVTLRGRRERVERRVLLEPRVILRQHAIDLRLLQHDFRHEDVVRVVRPAPRQVAPVPPVPGQQPIAEAAAVGRRRQRGECTARSARWGAATGHIIGRPFE